MKAPSVKYNFRNWVPITERNLWEKNQGSSIDAKLAKLFAGYHAGSKSTQEGKEENGKKFHDYTEM